MLAALCPGLRKVQLFVGLTVTLSGRGHVVLSLNCTNNGVCVLWMDGDGESHSASFLFNIHMCPSLHQLPSLFLPAAAVGFNKTLYFQIL